MNHAFIDIEKFHNELERVCARNFSLCASLYVTRRLMMRIMAGGRARTVALYLEKRLATRLVIRNV